MKQKHSALKSVWSDVSTQSCWDWCIENIDFSLCPSYESAMQGKFNADYMPYMKEPMNMISDPSVKEIIFLKCSRAGASENLLLMPSRYAAGVAPQPVMYASAQQETTEDFFNERLVKGMKLSKVTAKKLSESRVRGNILYMPDMHIVATWNKSITGFKQRGISLALADEVSSWADYGVLDIMRKRMDTFAFPHIVILSSPDATQTRPSDEDPIFIEFAQTDQRYFYMESPKTKEPFRFEMGSPDTPWGLKWSQKAKREDGTWDMNKVQETAHYVTPSGDRIENKDRRAVVATGKWVATNASKSRKGKAGFHLNQFYVPFGSGDFGHIACKFLDCKGKGYRSLRVFAYEVLAEKWLDNVESIASDDVIYQRCVEYGRGKSIVDCDAYRDIYKGNVPTVYMTVDVQKTCLWYVVRGWLKGGDSYLIDYGQIQTFTELEEIAGKYKAHKVYIDNSYAVRQQEVREESYTRKLIPTYGRENADLYAKMRVEPVFEGVLGDKRAQIGSFTFKPSIFKHLLFDMMRGESQYKWHLFTGIDREYVKQVTSEQCVDGQWVLKRGKLDNHLYDCCVLQVLAATLDGIHRLAI